MARAGYIKIERNIENLTGSTHAARLYSELLWRQKKLKKEKQTDDYFYLLCPIIEKACRFGRKMRRKCLKILVKLNLIEIIKKEKDHKNWYKVNERNWYENTEIRDDREGVPGDPLVEVPKGPQYINTSINNNIEIEDKDKKKIEEIKSVIEKHPYSNLFKKLLMRSALLLLSRKYSTPQTFKQSLDRVQNYVESKDKYKDKAASIEHLLLNKDREQKYYTNQPKNEQKGIEYPKWQPEERKEASTGLFDTSALMASFRQKSFNREAYA